MKKEYEWCENYVSAGHSFMDPFILRLIHRIQPSNVLDLGCGNGVLTKKIADNGFKVIGVDPSESGVAAANKMYPEMDFRLCGAYDDPEKIGLGRFDLIVAEEVIEHLYYPDELMKFSRRVLNPNGCLIITTPYYGYIKNLCLAIFNRWDHHLTPLWDHGHIKLFSKKSMQGLLARNQFTMREFHGVGNGPYLWKNMVVVAVPL
jgi:2-polyprenyl-3-methyl-5-hydroxy-6-metoxy-1,4-benzoquinol methylase